VALWRPDRALVALAFILPFGSLALTALDLPPVRLTEAMVLATLSGSLLRKSEGDARDAAAYPAALLAVIVLTSLVVVLGAREIGMSSPATGFQSAASFLVRSYLVGPAPELDGLTSAALLLEGLGLLWIVRRYAREHARPLLGAVVAASVAAAIVSFAQAATASASLAAFLRTRASGPVLDANAAGSYFAMAACAALAMALPRASTAASMRAMWGLAGVVLLGGVWLSGSRMAQVSVIAGATVLACVARLRMTGQGLRAVAAAAAIGAAVLIALAVGLDPRPAASRTALPSFSARADFMITGLRMIASAPIFGVGIGRYFETSGRFMPESIYWLFFHENAHNNFLQIAGELGLLGLAAFIWLLGAAAVRIARGLHAEPQDGPLVASATATSVFVATWLTSHPLLLPEVAYTFWVVLAIALGRADHALNGEAEPTPSRTLRWAMALAVVLIVVSVPLRARAAMAGVPRESLTFGFYDWENDNGFPYRWSSRRAAFFVPPDAREVHVPLRSMMIRGHLDPVRVSVAVKGRVLDTFIAEGNWTTVPLRLPPAANREFVRIDVITDPPWTPAATGTSQDVRVLGVEVGRPEIH
jgi:O-antigen ligase